MKIKSFVLIVLATFCTSSTMIFFYLKYLGYRCKAYRSNYRKSIYVQIVSLNFVKYLATTSKSVSIKGCDPNKSFIVTTLEIVVVKYVSLETEKVVFQLHVKSFSNPTAQN